jgi:hypothetical protein
MGEDSPCEGAGVTPGDFAEGEQVVPLSKPNGQTYLVGEDRPDGRVLLIRSCRCGGWFEATRADYVVAPVERWRRR